MKENKEFNKTIYGVKKQTLTFQEFLDFRNWVCSRLIDLDELTVAYDLRDVMMQFAFAKFYLDVELPNIDDNDKFLENYELVCGISHYDYYDYINHTQHRILRDSINKYLDQIQSEFDDSKRYDVNDFMKNIEKSITGFIDGMNNNFNNLDVEKVLNSLDKFQDLTNNKISLDTFIEHAKQVVDNDKLSKDELIESITVTNKKEIN